MSLAVQVTQVDRVLLADGWHDVADSSFDLDSYEYSDEGFTLHGGGQSGVCATGFRFTDAKDGRSIVGPLTSIIAVAERE